MTRSVSITLPWPPSNNHYWLVLRRGAMAGRVIISSEGKAYRKAVAVYVAGNRIGRGQLSGKLAVHILALPPDNRARDLDNLPKAVLDSLKHANAIRDDADIDDLHIVRGAKTPGGALQIELREIPGEATETKPLFEEAIA